MELEMKVLLTGATGFIGSYVLPILLDRGFSVNALVRDTSKARLPDHTHLKIFEGDINCTEDVDRAIEGCETIIHLAALVQSTAEDPEDFYKINYRGTENLLKAAKTYGVKKFIFASSLSACTYVPLPIINEESLVRPKKCFSDYAETKAEAEQLVKNYADENFHNVILYPTKVFGVGPLNALSLYLNNKLPFLIDKGEQFSNWSFVEDVAKGIVSAAARNITNRRYILGGENKTFAEFYQIADRITGRKNFKINISCKTALFIISLIEKSAKLTGKHPLITKEWLKFILQSQKLSSARAITELHYTITPLEIALEKTIRWLQTFEKVKNRVYNSSEDEVENLTAEGEMAR
jgi:nucleoside-diphosphate-sugar epimerase